MKHLNRRRFLVLSTSTTLLGLVPRFVEAKVIHKILGQVWVNDRLAHLDTIIKPGDTIRTGPKSQIIFIIDEDVYQLGAHSTLQLHQNDESHWVKAMRLVEGLLLAVFSPGNKEIHTPAATMGIRGTGLFLQVESTQTYFCTCYGSTEIITTGPHPQHQSVNATYHKAYSISHNPNEPQIFSDTMKNHHDRELFYLESLVGRTPPASFKENKR